MRACSILLLSSLLYGCSEPADDKERAWSSDSTELASLVRAREQAMIARDLDAVMATFDTAATFINGGGFYYKGQREIRAFHAAMFANDSLTYSYKAGAVTIDPVRPRVALVYYPWQQQWTMKQGPSDTLNETGLMTIVAVRSGGTWKWRAITNQRTKDYFDSLPAHRQAAMN